MDTLTAGSTHRLHPRVRTLWWWEAVWSALGLAVATAVVVVVATALAGSGGWRWPLGAGVAVLAGALAVEVWHNPARYRAWSYTFGEHALEVRHGVLWRTVSVTPYFRVQHIDIEQGPVERSLGLVRLQLRTASSATDATIPGIAAGQADELRALILSRAGRGDAV